MVLGLGGRKFPGREYAHELAELGVGRPESLHPAIYPLIAQYHAALALIWINWAVHSLAMRLLGAVP